MLNPAPSMLYWDHISGRLISRDHSTLILTSRSSDQGANSYVPGTIYVRQHHVRFPVNQVYVTKDSGLHWQNESPASPQTSTLSRSSSIRDQDNGNVIDGTDSGAMARQRPAGTSCTSLTTTPPANLSWVNISAGQPDVPANALRSIHAPARLYVGSDDGIYTLRTAAALFRRDRQLDAVGRRFASTPVAALRWTSQQRFTVGANLTGAITVHQCQSHRHHYRQHCRSDHRRVGYYCRCRRQHERQRRRSIVVLSNSTFSLTGRRQCPVYRGRPWTAQGRWHLPTFPGRLPGQRRRVRCRQRPVQLDGSRGSRRGHHSRRQRFAGHSERAHRGATHYHRHHQRSQSRHQSAAHQDRRRQCRLRRRQCLRRRDSRQPGQPRRR